MLLPSGAELELHAVSFSETKEAPAVWAKSSGPAVIQHDIDAI